MIMEHDLRYQDLTCKTTYLLTRHQKYKESLRNLLLYSLIVS